MFNGKCSTFLAIIYLKSLLLFKMNKCSMNIIKHILTIFLLPLIFGGLSYEWHNYHNFLFTTIKTKKRFQDQFLQQSWNQTETGLVYSKPNTKFRLFVLAPFRMHLISFIFKITTCLIIFNWFPSLNVSVRGLALLSQMVFLDPFFST